MMKKCTLILIALITTCSNVFAQNKVSINFGYGYYLKNSENSLKVMGDKKFQSHWFYGFAFQRDDILGLNLIIDYSYHQITKKDVLMFVRTSSASPEVIGSFGSDMSLISHNIDVDYTGKINEYFSYGIGPSFVIVNRIFKIDENNLEGYNLSFEDRLASSGLGANVFFDFTFPLNETKNFFFITSKLKLRYTHSIWFDKGIRNLDNYNQEFITLHLSLGVGYSF